MHPIAPQVSRDLSNLEERARWVVTHPDESARIARRGQAHARQYLTYEAAVAATRRLLLERTRPWNPMATTFPRPPAVAPSVTMRASLRVLAPPPPLAAPSAARGMVRLRDATFPYHRSSERPLVDAAASEEHSLRVTWRAQKNLSWPRRGGCLNEAPPRVAHCIGPLRRRIRNTSIGPDRDLMSTLVTC